MVPKGREPQDVSSPLVQKLREAPFEVVIGGDVMALAATAILRQRFPDLKLRFINVVDLFRLVPSPNIRMD